MHVVACINEVCNQTWQENAEVRQRFLLPTHFECPARRGPTCRRPGGIFAGILARIIAIVDSIVQVSSLMLLTPQ
jgi:hypothetical protein